MTETAYYGFPISHYMFCSGIAENYIQLFLWWKFERVVLFGNFEFHPECDSKILEHLVGDQIAYQVYFSLPV